MIIKYKFIPEEKEYFLEGRTTTYVANKINLSRQHTCNILNGKANTTLETSLSLIKVWLNAGNIKAYPEEYLDVFFREV